MTPHEVLVDNCTEYGGFARYDVKLFVLPDSELSDRDIAQVLGYASWMSDFDHAGQWHNGARDVVIRRETPSDVNGVPMEAIQINGIGYRPSAFSGHTLAMGTPEGFRPPSAENFMSYLPDGINCILFADDDGETCVEVPEYRPTGTIMYPGIVRRIQNTQEIGEHPFETFVVPPILGYGFYNNDELSHDGEPFGFVVVANPGVGEARVGRRLLAPFPQEEYGVVFSHYSLKAHEDVEAIATAAAEFHQAGYTHQQLHPNNMFRNGLPKLVITDWDTMRKRPKNEEAWAKNRAYDILAPVDRTVKRTFNAFPQMRKRKVLSFGTELLQTALSTYSSRIAGGNIDADHITLDTNCIDDVIEHMHELDEMSGGSR